MRLGLCASALTLAAVAAPADAAVYLVGISGSLSGTTTTVLCTGGADCNSANSQRVDPFASGFSTVLGTLNLSEGDNSFSFGSPYGSGFFTGIINNAGGVLTGRNLSFSQQSCAPGVPAVGCRINVGSAVTFAVSGGVPEPATWALMLLGFGAIGIALRRRSTTVKVRFAA